MYLSRIRLDPSLRATVRALSSPGIMHAIVARVFEGSTRTLWRADDDAVLVVSSVSPAEPRAALQIGAMPETKDYDAFLSSLEQNGNYRFRLCANPVHSVQMQKGDRGKVLAHVTIAQQNQWLLKKAAAYGFEPKALEITRSEFVKFRRQGDWVSIKQAIFEGALTVTDIERFRGALVNGIGRGKAYGCGLLTVA